MAAVIRDPDKMNFHTHKFTLAEIKQAIRDAQMKYDLRKQKDGDITWNCLMVAEQVIDHAFYQFIQDDDFYNKRVDINA